MADQEETPVAAPAEEAEAPPPEETPPAEPAAEAEAQPAAEGGGEASPGEEAPAAEPEGDAPAAEETAAAAEEQPATEQSTEVTDGGEPAAEAADGEAVDKPEGDAEAAPAEGGEGAEESAEPNPEGEVTADGEKAAEEGGEGEVTEAKEGEEGAAPADAETAPAAEGEEAAEKVADGEAEPAEGEAGEEGEKPADEEGAADVPQSDTFADGEKPESPAPHVGEVLSRAGSAGSRAGSDVERKFTPPVADSPRERDSQPAEEQFDVEALEEEILSPEQDREALVELYHTAIAEREQLQQQNHQLQHKLAEYFKKKKSDEQKPDAVDKNEADQEQRYLKYMSQLEELRAEDQQIRDEYTLEIEELQRRCDEKQHEVDAHRFKFEEFKHQVALNALNSRSGKPIPTKDIDSYLAAEKRKDQEVITVRLENIKLKNKLKKKEQQLKSKEELADGLHLIDFEQLKIENQTYNEKIEERNEELLKLRKKITNTVQVLTHLKEKLQFVQGENSLLKGKLKDVEGAVAQKRDVLTRTKQARDALRIDNHRLRQNCGLLGNEPLLRDFEERKDEADSLKDRLERLKMQHAELTLNTASVRRKIEQIKASDQQQ